MKTVLKKYYSIEMIEKHKEVYKKFKESAKKRGITLRAYMHLLAKKEG